MFPLIINLFRSAFEYAAGVAKIRYFQDKTIVCLWAKCAWWPRELGILYWYLSHFYTGNFSIRLLQIMKSQMHSSGLRHKRPSDRIAFDPLFVGLSVWSLFRNAVLLQSS